MSDILWMGRPLDDLSREELVEAVEYLATEIENLRSPTESLARALGKVEMMKQPKVRVEWYTGTWDLRTGTVIPD